MPSKFVWRRTMGDRSETSSSREPGSLYETDDKLSRQQRQLETPIYAPGGVFYQVPPLPNPPGPGSRTHEQHQSDELHENNEPSSNAMPTDSGLDNEETPDKLNNTARARVKREQQWQRWNSIIPEMLEPYVSLLRETNSLRDMSLPRERKLCKGCSDQISLEVLCVYFDIFYQCGVIQTEIEKIKLCTCKPPALQLLSKGLFPCAPSRPTLAVDMNMLEFARDLFQNLAPNTTAWAETLEQFLDKRGFKLKTKDTLRIRFGNALQWYATLQDTKSLKLAEFLNHIRQSEHEDRRCHPLIFVNFVFYLSERFSRYKTCTDVCSCRILMLACKGPSDGEEDFNPHHDSTRPSEYLRQRCLLCFGGRNWHHPDDLIVCIDANFTQKRRKSQGNAPPMPHQHPETLFISPEDVSAMQAEVETARPAKTKKTVDDPYEPGMKVPSATLDECHESFTAADSNRVKASTQFFADTGLMALICRHDRVLWLVNMTSPGEKQYYALCLLRKLFQHIPSKMRIGVLYDIGCQLHRSCVKYDFLDEVLDRITFGISVFHAYGHQWPCQIIYHPRKCLGFGLSDGEGCERFWSAIKSLIPSLRVSGYYTRLYAINTKVRQLDNISLLGLGHWLQRKWGLTQERKHAAVTALQSLYQRGITEDCIREEWAKQVKAQTKPLPRQSKTIADKEIYSILALRENVKDYSIEIAALEDTIITGTFIPGMIALEAQAHIQELKQKSKASAKAIEEKTTKLSLADQKNLKRLLGNDFLRTRMNALAVKQRIRERLRHRKYELESFGSSYRNTVNHQKLQQHAEQQIKRKEPGIQNLARTYNKLCQDLEKMIAARTVPKGARAPSKISLEGLFKLDVDHDIWQDDDLTNDIDDSIEIPGWLGNDDVRAGIKLLLQYDRCVEEEKRLIHERQAMQEWFIEEWNLVNLALAGLEKDGDINLAYQFKTLRTKLVDLCLAWRTAVLSLPCSLGQNWGPTQEDIKAAEAYKSTEQVTEAIEEDSSIASDQEIPEDFSSLTHSRNWHMLPDDIDLILFDEEELEEGKEAEAELVDAMEGFDLAEEFRQEG
ncbi:hypothetical protein CVT26_014513 [Gymnopilus dilepis]|uniref:CxC1-like cysteine cluster associated with KDZ transposases domain-containing protein n=1 Tax=Gymnopilus dilepis TaxID=231916 RepID=A0A409W3C6_9AGAR|nr:hypothetical protein CVT26_014513 [Gymnopilus dilepis]